MIEMLAVMTSHLMHLQAALYILEQCGFAIEQHWSLFSEIRPLLVCNTVDQTKLAVHHQAP